MNPLQRTFASLGIISIVILAFLVVPQESSARLRLFKATSEISIKPDQSYFENLSLNREVKTNLTIVYSYSRFSIPSGYLFLTPSPTKINLEVMSKPKWCDVQLEKENLSAEMPLTSIFGGNVTLEVGVTIKVTSKDAPGYKEGKIVIGAKALDNGNINSSEAKCEIKIKPGFYPDVEVNENFFRLELSPGEEKEIPIEITNNGNMEIIASIDTTEELPDLVLLDLSEAKSIDIGPGKSKTVKLKVEIKRYDKKIDEKYSIPLELSYYAKDYKNLKGESLDLDINLRVKGEPKSIFPGFDLAFIEALVIIVLIIVLIFVIIRCRA